MAKKADMGWRAETAFTLAFILLTILMILFSAEEAYGYETWHAEKLAPPIVKAEGLVVHKLIDGPIVCYIVITEARMIGFQQSLSCVLRSKEKEHEPEQDEGGRVPHRVWD